MPEKHIALALSLAKILFHTREQFAEAIRDAAMARIKASPARSVYAGRAAIPRRALEPHVDDALYAIGVEKLYSRICEMPAAMARMLIRAFRRKIRFRLMLPARILPEPRVCARVLFLAHRS